MTPADLVKLARAAKSGKKVTSGLSAAKEAATISNMQQAGELPLSAAELISHSADKALPLVLPRANLSSDFINKQAERVARQMLGEHVTSGKPKDTANLAGRSKKESQRLKELDYKLTPIGTVAEETIYKPRKGDVKVAFPGDQTVSDKILEEVEGFPIDSVQQGGAYYGLGQRHLPEPEFWKSTEVPAKNVQGKVNRAAQLYEPDRVIGSHLAMGPMSNNFAMHFADANLRAIDWSKADPNKINIFDNIIAGGYKDPKTKELITFPNWPGIADREGALEAMKENTLMRKWFNNRMKTPKVTKPLGLPNGLSIQYAITEPRLRDMEINMTGLMTGELRPGALVEAAGNPHNTYSHRILGEAGGPQEVLTPFVIDFPDAAQHIASTKNPSDFTGTIQKVFPHQIVDDQYINQYNQYRERIKQLTGKKQGGLAHMSGGGTPEPKRKSILDLTPLTEAAAAVQNAFRAESGTYRDKGAAMDILNRGIVADTLGGAADLANLPLQGLDWLQSNIPGLSKPASVMDVPSTSPRLSNQPNTALKFPLSTDKPFGGSEAWKELFQKSGVTSKTERPVAEISTSLLAPFAPFVASKAAKVAKAIAPRAGDLAYQFMNKQAEAMGLPLEMGITPKGGAKLSKEEYAAMMREKYASQNKPKAAKVEEVKAPANDLGFYSATEKAALNLPRKSGTGDAFIADLLKQPDVSPARLDEMGITEALKGRKDVTRDEVQALVAESKIPLDESVRGTVYDEAGMSKFDYELKDLNKQLYAVESDRILSQLNGDDIAAEDYQKQMHTIRKQITKIEEANDLNKPKFSPDTHPDYSTPGGENYREIRINLPSQRPSLKNMGRDEYNAAVAKADAEGIEDFYHFTHHDDQPNVLTHLRVADHVDAEGKSGLLIDELQSDWHQKGRDKGYQGQLPEGAKVTYNKDINKYVVWKDGKTLDFGATEQEAIKNASRKFGSVPEAPFKENWYQLGLKRAIKEAADTGKDRLYLTTGETQNKRYDLSKHVSEVHLSGSDLVAYDKSGNKVITETGVNKDNLADYIGKEAAKKLLEQKPRGTLRSLSGVDLQVGGEGMKQYYDKTYLNWLKKYAKEHGATVGETKLPGASKKVGDLSTKERHDLLDNPEFKKEVERNVEEASLKNSNRPTMEVLSEAWDKALENIFAQKVYYMEITPKMRKSAEKGQAYAKGGAVRMAEGGQAPSNWTDYLSQHAQEESMRLMGGDTALNPMKDGGSIDDMIRNAVEKANSRNYASGGAVNIDDLIQKAITLRNQHA